MVGSAARMSPGSRFFGAGRKRSRVMPDRPIPSYRLHRPSGQAVVTIDGKDQYLGKHDSPESHAEYDRRIDGVAGAQAYMLLTSDSLWESVQKAAAETHWTLQHVDQLIMHL